MSADKMLKKLGFVSHRVDDVLWYEPTSSSEYLRSFGFDEENKEVVAINLVSMDYSLICAIKKKLEELGWR